MNSQFTGNNGCVAVSVEALYDVGHFLVGGVETKRLHRDLELFAIDAVGVIGIEQFECLFEVGLLLGR